MIRQTNFENTSGCIKVPNNKEAWCDRCKKSTTQEIIGEGSGNTETQCECGCRNFQIQGFNINLM